MRGKGTSAVVMRRQLGITPAYAGKSRTRRCWTKTTAGSPPRMRGKGFGVVRRNGRPRITPAYAGKRQRPRRFPQGDRDHPRVCGEKSIRILRMWERTGSPPRMRGKGVIISNGEGIVRITPAYAGKRLKRSRSTVPPVAIVPLFPSVCNKPVVSDGSPAGRDAPLFLPAENAVPASPAYNLRSL